LISGEGKAPREYRITSLTSELKHEHHSAFHHEVPYEPPNIDNSPTRSISPVPASTSAQQQPVASSSRPKGGRGTIIPVATAVPAPEPTSSVPLTAADVARHPGAAGVPVTAQDKYELAKFLVEYPKKENVSFAIHVEPFRKTVRITSRQTLYLIGADVSCIQYYRGQLRSPAAWKYIYKKYGEDIRKLMNRILKKTSAGTSATGKDMRETSPSSTAPRTSVRTSKRWALCKYAHTKNSHVLFDCILP
jgi:hypothetical protein